MTGAGPRRQRSVAGAEEGVVDGPRIEDGGERWTEAVTGCWVDTH